MYKLLSPDNQIIEFDCVKDFIKTYNLSSRIFSLLNGNQIQYKGWRRVDTHQPRDVESQLRYILANTFSRAKQRIIKSSNDFNILLEATYPNISLPEQIYLFERSMECPPVCCICGRPVFFHSEKRGYYETCSKRCMNGVRHDFTKEKVDAIRESLDQKDALSFLLTKNDQKTVAQQMGVSVTMVGDYARKHNITDGYTSNLERSIALWLKTLPFNFKTNRKVLENRKEIDFYCEEMRFGIEVNGLYRHTELSGQKTKWYHQDKLQECSSKGIGLLLIFEDEWYDHMTSVQNIIKTRLGLQDIGVGARSLDIHYISKTEAKSFLYLYHLQGACTYNIGIGAYNGQELVGVMVFGRPTRRSKYEYELKRYCTNGVIYPGLASKLFKTFIREHQPENVVSFCDKRYFTGLSYIKMGFRHDKDISPDYSYTNDYRHRYHKSNFKLKQIQQQLNPNISVYSKSEAEWMRDLGYDRIWDCGKIRFVWEHNK